MRRLIAILLAMASQAQASGLLSDNLRITSESLGYDLQYRVYLPEGHDELVALPVIYVTDGPSYIGEGRMPRVLDREIASGRIRPVIAVFVDARDPDDPDTNRRNQQFVCNRDYLRFFSEELVPTIERRYHSAADRDSRVILGVSFGGLNAACFGLMGFETFGGIGMHSPAVHPVPGLLPAYEQVDRLPIRVFLSTGDSYDNTAANRQFRRILEDKGYDLHFREVAGRHNWDNWRPLIDDALRFFFESPER
jgi:enterochelin esterase-like enzyme